MQQTEKDLQIQNQLAPPGAGIPLPARLFLTWVVRPLRINRSDWSSNLRRFWVWLLGTHTGIHTTQIQKILSGLKP